MKILSLFTSYSIQIYFIALPTMMSAIKITYAFRHLCTATKLKPSHRLIHTFEHLIYKIVTKIISDFRKKHLFLKNEQKK